MKRFFLLSLSALAFISILSSCKKGENDPFLSLRSRKARVAGEWTVTSVKETSSYTLSNGDSGQSTTTYDGTTSTYNSTITSNGVTNPATSVEYYTVKYTFEKDGTVTGVIRDEDGSSTTATGTWMFLGKNKEAELKNKEALLISFHTQVYTGGGDGTDTYDGIDGENIFIIDQLKNKEMIWKEETSSTDSDGSTHKSTQEIVLTQQ